MGWEIVLLVIVFIISYLFIHLNSSVISYCFQERRCIYCIWAQVWCDQEANRDWSWYWWSRENAPQDSWVRLDTDILLLDTNEGYSKPRYNWRIFWTQIQLKDILDPDLIEGYSGSRYNWRIFWTQIQLKTEDEIQIFRIQIQ